MLKVSEQWLRDVEERYPGIRGTIDHYEALNLPPCPACGSADTAAVSADIGGPDPGEGARQVGGSLLLDVTTATDEDLEAFVRAIHAQGEKDARVQRLSDAEGADGPKSAG
jgi:hypothetical protein